MPRRNASEYAKKFGFKPQDFENTAPKPDYLRAVLAYGAGMLLMYHVGIIYLIKFKACKFCIRLFQNEMNFNSQVVRDRRAHYEVFISQYEEGREYLTAAPNNYWMWRYVPDVDRFFGVDIGKAK